MGANAEGKDPPRSRPRLGQLAGSAVIRLMVMIVRSLPPRSIGPLSWLAGTIWYGCDARRRKRIAENLRVAFGATLDDAGRRKRARRVFRNMARVPIEVLWFDRLLATPRQIEERLTFHGAWPSPDGEPGVIVSGHFGNWEACIRAVRHRLGRVRTVVRPVGIPALDDLVTRIRGGPESILEKHGAYRGLLRSLRDGWWAAMASDQNAGASGLFLPFFGLAASTHVTPAHLALRQGAALHFIAGIRRPGPELAFDVHLAEVAHPAAGSAEPEAVEHLTEEVNRRLEAWVRKAPDQYNFLHRRWKDRPPGEVPGPHLPAYDHHRPPAVAKA